MESGVWKQHKLYILLSRLSFSILLIRFDPATIFQDNQDSWQPPFTIYIDSNILEGRVYNMHPYNTILSHLNPDITKKIADQGLVSVLYNDNCIDSINKCLRCTGNF